MTMSDGKTNLRKIAFQLGNKFYRFAVNPESIVYSRPHRATAVKTKSRIVVEDFQDDIPTVTIGGTTGFNPTGRVSDRGINKIKEMKEYLIYYARLGGNGNKSASDLFFHDFTNDESYVVHLSPEGVTYTQDVSSPLTYRYDIKFVILREANEPSDEEKLSPEIGNRFPSLPKGKEGKRSPYDVNKADPYDPTSGNDKIYNSGVVSQSQGSSNNSPMSTSPSNDAVNPQAPSSTSYTYGMGGLGYSIGYYLRRKN